LQTTPTTNEAGSAWLPAPFAIRATSLNQTSDFQPISKFGDRLALVNLETQYLLGHAVSRINDCRALKKEIETFEQVANALTALRKETARHGVILSEGEDGEKP
jgi:hypothetical protein